MVLLIIIPIFNGYFIGNINPTFSDKPKWGVYVEMSAQASKVHVLSHLRSGRKPSVETWQEEFLAPGLDRFDQRSCATPCPPVVLNWNPNPKPWIWIMVQWKKWMFIWLLMFKFQQKSWFDLKFGANTYLGRSSFQVFWVSITVTAIYCPQEFKTSLLADWHCIHWVNSSVFTMD